MQQSSIEQIDRAALALLEALTAHGEELASSLEAGDVAALKQGIVNLRRELLGLQMGPLYWETPPQSTDKPRRQDT